MDNLCHQIAVRAHQCKTRWLTVERLFKFLVVLMLLGAITYHQF